MKIWVDADACPTVIKELLFKAALRTNTPVTLVANQFLKMPPSPLITFIKVASGMDTADNEIVAKLKTGDLVITADIPLAADVIEKGGHALNPRGEMYTKEDIRSRLSMRDFMEELRNSGVETGGAPPMSPSDKQQFANQLDRFLAKHKV